MSSEEERLFSVNNIINYALDDYRVLTTGLFFSVLVGWYVFKRKVSIREKLIYILAIITLTIVAFFIQNSPKPKFAYALSFLYKDKAIVSDFKHKNKNNWIFVGSAVLTINNDNYIFVGGGDNQKDALLYFDNDKKKFINIIDKTNLSSYSNTFSAVSFDLDKDGKNDLIVGRGNGVWLYKSLGDFKFKKIKLVGQLDKVPLAIAISDYNRDGKPDIYTSYFTPMKKYRGSVFNDLRHGRKNMLLKNVSKGKKIMFRDVTKEAGAGGQSYNTFTASFIDLNNDLWPDIVLSHDSGEVEILKNRKGKFESRFAIIGKGNWMGLAHGDIDNDGDQDLFLTNIGTDTRKDNLSEGDIKPNQKQEFKHVLLRNDGKFRFVEASQELGIDGSGFGWGAVFADIDLDTDLDLLFAENTKLFPLHHLFPKPGHYYENKNGKYVRKFKYHNHNFGQTPIITDINNDNIKDIIWINMNGPVNAYINKNKENNYLIVDLPETNDFVNATVELDTGKQKYYKQIVQGGVGFGSDQDNKIVFGLGNHKFVKSVRVRTIENKIYYVQNPKINSILKVVVNK